MTPRTRVLAVDFGTKRIGLAVSDPERRIASPLQTLERSDPARERLFFSKLIESEEIGLIVVGLPIHTTGREGGKAREARAYGDWLAKVADLPIRYWDERFTTQQAEESLWDAGLTHKQRKERRDKVAAQMILQAFLEAGCPAETLEGPLEG